MIKNVFLDLDDTILDFQKGERVALIKAFSDYGIPTDDVTVERYIQINLQCWRALERGEMTKDEVLVGRFAKLFEELGIDKPADEVQNVYERYLGLEHDFLPGGKELLDAFRDGGKYTLYMATNGIPTVQYPRIRDSGVGEYFKEIFISQEIGYAKPNAKFFEECFKRIPDFKRKETIMVGDNLNSDIGGGKNAGILTCHYNFRGTEYMNIVPDFTITDLSELIPILDSIK